MCMMTVACDETLGGGAVMENVIELTEDDRGVHLVGLLDEPVTIADARVAHIDFRRGRTLLTTRKTEP